MQSTCPFNDGAFDRIFASLNLMIVPRPQQALKELRARAEIWRPGHLDRLG